MKEATGELNLTVITVVAIAAIGTFFYFIIWPTIKTNVETSTKCASIVSCSDCQNGVCSCTDVNGSTIKCPDKNTKKDAS